MHIAIIMDGNGRWAKQRGLPRARGHAAGADAVRKVVETAAAERIDTLTLYAFSQDNWKRPPTEVSSLLRLLRRYLITETPRCIENNICLNIIGRRDRLPSALVRVIEKSECATANLTGLHLRIAVDYSSQWSLLRAAHLISDRVVRTSDFRYLIDRAIGSSRFTRDVDLLIRTGGDQRLSDFLLFECAYAELLFVPDLWPDFTAAHLARALTEYSRRDRRFGGFSVQENHRGAAT